MSGNMICDRCGGRVFKDECDCEPDPVLTPEQMNGAIILMTQHDISRQTMLDTLATIRLSHDALREQLDSKLDYPAEEIEDLREQLRQAQKLVRFRGKTIHKANEELAVRFVENARLRDAIGAGHKCRHRWRRKSDGRCFTCGDTSGATVPTTERPDKQGLTQPTAPSDIVGALIQAAHSEDKPVLDPPPPHPARVGNEGRAEPERDRGHRARDRQEDWAGMDEWDWDCLDPRGDHDV